MPAADRERPGRQPFGKELDAPGKGRKDLGTSFLAGPLRGGHWFSHASRRLALDHAYFEARRGRRGAALAILDEPVARDEPDAHLLAMRILVDDGNADAAASRLIRALALAPIALLDVERDEAAAPLRSREDVQRAMRDARRRLR